jgi:hypothetical protein
MMENLTVEHKEQAWIRRNGETNLENDDEF